MADINEHFADLMDDYLHALLSPGRAVELEHHCASCPACQAALEDARRRRAILQGIPPSEASAELITNTLRRIDSHDRRRRRRLARFFITGVAALAACALVLIGVHVYYNRLSATPYDLVVLGQHNLLASANSSLRIRLMDRLANTALAGVPVIVELRGNGRSAELVRFNTDANGVGQPRFRLPDWPDGDYGLVVTAQTPGGTETLAHTIRLTRSWKLMLTSDKPIYQPGQTIHVRALALRQPDLRPVAEQKTVFTLADPKGNVLFKHEGQTSPYGIAATDCLLAGEVAEGAYTLACKVGDTESRLRVEVRKYVLPKFKVDVRPDCAFYQPKGTARIMVQADYFFGKPVADAEVELVVRKAQPPAEVLQRFSVRTDAKGTANVEYAIPDQPQGSGDIHLSFAAAVTDSAGQKQTGGVERTVTRQPVRIEVLPENGTLVQGVPNIVYLLATRADGTAVRARLTIGGLNEVVDTDANGLASCEVTPGGAGVRWDIVARDADDKEIARRTVNLLCGPARHDFLLRTDRGSYESGQTMRLTADGDGGEPVFVDFFKGDQTLLSETIEMSGGHGAAAFDLPPDLFGTVRLCAYRLDAGGVWMSKTRTLYIRPSGQLKITPKLDQKEYRPGRRARLDLTLTDAAGNPCRGALSLAGVDEAVFSVLAQRPGTEETFYTLERSLLQPVFNLYPWSPGQKAADAERLERALFAATTATNVGVESPPSRDPLRTRTPGLRDSSGLHSLAASSLPGKVEEVERNRTKGIDRVKIAWMVLVFVGLGLGYAALWCFLRPLIVLIIHGAALWIVMPLLILALAARNERFAVETQTEMAQTAEDIRLERGGGGSQRGESDLTNTDLGMDGQPVVLNLNVDRIVAFMQGWETEPRTPAPRVRKAFPETLLWTPQLITDDHGRAQLDIDLADSITTWRISASAVAADGRLGAAQLPLKVFQPFFVDLNLPVSLTRNDEVSVPVVVYNYLDKPQTVTLKLKSAAWFALSGEAEQRLDLAPREVRATSYRIKAAKVGRHDLQVAAFASGISDALKRTIEVVPDGRPVEQVFNRSLWQRDGMTLLIPDNAVEGSAQTFVKIYPSGFTQLVEGLDSIFQMPSGCFEQTSSTTYPNILALEYLRKTGRSFRFPGIEAKARQYIHLGYQRLIGFEVPGGGFDWFGRPPANRTLTAYGLMEFEDMAYVHAVDPQLIDRTRRWLLDQRKSDGSWAPEGHALHDDLTRGDAKQARLATTAYIAWAVFDRGRAAEQSPPTRNYLLSHPPESIKDPHVLALVCHALLALDPQGGAARPYLERLDALKHVENFGQYAWWEQPEGARTTFFGAGRSGKIETTALAALALLHGSVRNRYYETTRAALTWLIGQKDARGTWHSTQATVLTLQALLATGVHFGDGRRRILVLLGDKFRREIVIPPNQEEVLTQFDLSPFLSPGRQRLELLEQTTIGGNYQVTFRYHVPETKPAGDAEPLTVRLDYDRTELRVGESVKVTAKVANHLPAKAAMVMVDLPVPAGFTVQNEDFAAMVQAGRIARFQVQAGSVLVYLRELSPKSPLELSYHLQATMAVKISAPGARVYEYYDPDREGRSAGTQFTVTARR